MLKKVLKILIQIIKGSISLLFVVLFFLAIFLSMALRLGTDWAVKNYSFTSFDEILYTLGTSVTTASKDILDDFFESNIYPPLQTTLIILGIFVVIYIIYKLCFRNSKIQLRITIFKKQFHIKFNIAVFIFMIACIIPIYTLTDSIVYAMDKLYINEYIEDNAKESSFFEEEYVNPADVKLEFPKEKRNLIYIFLESMESTYTNYENGGAYPYNYIPNLTELAQDNINFSNNDNVGGAHMPFGASWTMGGMVAATAGVPIKTPFSVIDANQEENYENGLVNGATTIGDILAKEGYHQSIMVGSDLSFGGRRTYYKGHGDYQVFDIYTAREDDIIPDDYYVFWGYEDDKLFDYAKQELEKVADGKEPFNFTMLTVDTHMPDGFESDFCPNYSSNPYLNAIYCSDMQLGEFVEWIQDQDFYDNTTVILAGDHLSMNTTSFNNLPEGYERRVYNVYLNSAVDTDNTKNRDFTTFDYYPTTLAALGVKIQGDRLGLGTNLFSDKKTLSEKYGNDYIDQELRKKSTYYDACINLDNCK